jgi:hypothetical protein
MAERVVVVAVDGSEQADKAFACKYLVFILSFYSVNHQGIMVASADFIFNGRDDLRFRRIQGARIY